jgi:nicotinamide-nucleotide amidase
MTENRHPLSTAEVIAVGSELLGTTRVDTNSLYLAGRLGSLGIRLRAKSVVGDDRRELAHVLRAALERVDLIVLSGGLGPTDDDVTREAVADVLGLPMSEDPAIVERIRARFAKRGLRMPEVNRKQAMVPSGATVLRNPLGTAPGLMIEHGRKLLVLLPGPPRELQTMFDSLADGPLKERTGEERLFQAKLFVTGQPESQVEEIAQPLYSRWLHTLPAIETTILAAPGQIELHLSTRSSDEASATRLLAGARDELAEALGPDVFSTDGRPMEQIVGELLARRGLTIGVAESCTGGLLLSRLTDVPGSSAWVTGGVVAYSNALKSLFADVPDQLIQAHGAVSEPVAVAMAEGIRTRVGSDIGVGVTGIAGPSGGSEKKPVGTVAISVVGPEGPARVRTFWFLGGRTQVKFNATQAAMDMVRHLMLPPGVRSRFSD